MKCPLCNKRLKIKAEKFKDFMKMAKETQNGNLASRDQEIIGEMLSKDTLGNSYSVDINVSQMIYHDLNSSIHYAADYNP
jgi:hypothetical protein